MASTLRDRIPVILPAGYALKNTATVKVVHAAACGLQGSGLRKACTCQNTPDPRQVAQSLAERMWAVATSEDHAIARFDCDTYKAADSELHGALMTAYGITDQAADRVRALLSEYGPDDSLIGTTGRGIASYVQFALSADGDDYRYNM